jgi:peptidyl-prolyl cis-trans isomerase B (cyclophilin B)
MPSSARSLQGTDVVDQIKAVKTGNKMGHADVPVTDVVIEKAVAL